MPLTDRRELEFDEEVLIAAVAVSQRVAQSLGLPANPPAAVRFHPKENEVAFLYWTDPTNKAVRIKSAALGALLIGYCIRARVPIPRNAERAVRIEAASVILTFRTQIAMPLKPAAQIAQPLGDAPATGWSWSEPKRVTA